MQWLEKLLNHFSTENIILLETHTVTSYHIRGDRKLFELSFTKTYNELPISSIRYWFDAKPHQCYFGVEGNHAPTQFKVATRGTYEPDGVAITWFNPPV